MDRNHLRYRLAALDFLEEEDWSLLDRLLERHQFATPGEIVVLEKQELKLTRVILSGWGFRFRSLPDGRRQILNFLVPGDVVGYYATVIARSDCGVEALTDMEYAVFPASDLVEVSRTNPRLMLALGWIAGQSERILDEQITRIGSRNARIRMAHMLVELYVRLRKAGLDRDQSSALPVTQAILADALGMSAVHANRTFRSLAAQGWISREHGAIRLEDIRKLSAIASFDHDYLDHGEVPPPTLGAIEDALSPD